MAFVLELIPLIAEAVEGGAAVAAEAAPAMASTTAEVGTAATEATVAGTEAATAGAEASTAGAEGTTTAGEAGGTTAGEAGGTTGESGAAGTEASTQAASKVPVFDMTASGTTAGANAAHQAIIDGAIQFGQWVAVQATKQALFYAGMKGAEALFHAMAGSSTDPAAAALAAKVNQTNTAVDALHTTTQDWSQWSTAHYDKRNSYGSVQVMGTSITHFEILQYNLGSLADMLSEQVAPALVAFNKTKTAADLDTLRAALLAYAQKVKGQSDSIAQNERAMVADGLQAHQEDVAKAIAALS